MVRALPGRWFLATIAGDRGRVRRLPEVESDGVRAGPRLTAGNGQQSLDVPLIGPVSRVSADSDQHHDHGEHDKRAAPGGALVTVRRSVPRGGRPHSVKPVSYTHLRAHETRHDLVCRL